MVKNITFLILSVFVSISVQAAKIEAVVNKDVITDTDISKRAQMLKYVSGQARDKGTSELNKLALYDLIISSIKNQLAAKNGVSVSNEDVAETKKRMFQGQKMEFPFDEREYDKSLKNQISWARFVNGRFGPKVNIGDTEVDEYMDQAEKSGALPIGNQINLSQIVLMEKEKADEVYKFVKDIKSCSNFNSAADDYGQAGSGSVGEINLNQMDKGVAEFLKKSSVGKALPPVETAAGHTIFFICSKKSATKKEKEELKEQMKNNIVQQKAEIMGEKYLKDSFSEFHVDIKNERYKEIMNELH
jgi:parvulin-like peptidyl-prolyl isomerase